MGSAAFPVPQTAKRVLLSSYFFVTAILGAASLLLYSGIPSESQQALLWGLSLERLLVMGGLLGLALIFCALGILVWLPGPYANLTGRLDRLLADRRKFWLAVWLASSALLSGAFFVLSTQDIREPFTQAFYLRLGPLAIWIAGLGIETLIALGLYRYISSPAVPIQFPREALLSTLLFGLFLLVWVWVSRSRVGLVAENVGWNRLGAPLLETHVLLMSGIGLAYLAVGLFVIHRLGGQSSGLKHGSMRIDLLISAVIWLAAVLYWISVPLQSSWFASNPRPPNFEWYPNSDASVYDITAQNVLVGEGFKSWELPYAVRVFYAFFLTLLHVLAGPGYERIINLQVLVLALLPVFIYWIVRRLHNRLSALIVAGLVVLREGSSISLADVITVSHAKLLMSDLPAALAVSLYILLVVIWLKEPDRRRVFPLAAGGVLGFGMLIRPELGVLAAVPAVLSVPALVRRPSFYLKNIAWLALGLALALTPWLVRNWAVGGRIFLDSPGFRADLIAQRYSPAPAETDIEQKPGETTDQYTQRMRSSAAEFVKEQPAAIPRFLLNHYMNSQIQLVLELPSTFRFFDSAIELTGHRSPALFWERCCSAEGYVRRLPFWWHWNGDLPGEAVVPVLANLFLLSLGLVAAWKYSGPAGMAPLLAVVLHLAVNAAFRNSGGRYILPVDWAAILYYGIGITRVLAWGVELFSRSPIPPALLGAGVVEAGAQASSQSPHRKYLAVAMAILLVATAVPAVEKVFPPRFTDETKQELLDSVLDRRRSPLDRQTVDMLDQLLKNQGVVLEGRALYPRYHRSGSGEPGSTWPSFYPRDYPRLSFYLVGPVNRGVVLPYRRPPKEFSNGAHVLVFGCPGKDYFHAAAVLVLDPSDGSVDAALLSRPPSAPRCPLESPD